ncbi:hypothetical protein AB5N19_04365 [Seiridium cardinale]|uniref:DUF6594 domain-containing protein n=1 Tax=Seiridium cardinale TaxID=138064 RepID=A0ABR2Y8J8_9PEZI
MQLQGYPFLAKFWTMTRDGMIRKFDNLALLNILYLQAELCHLETDLEDERRKDIETGERARVDCDWNWLLLNSDKLNQGSKQWKVIIEMREKLTEYHSAILQYTQMARLRAPTESQRNEVFKILGSSTMTNGCLGHFQSLDLGGLDGPGVYQKRLIDDLVLLDALEEDNDFLARWIKPVPQDLEYASVGQGELDVYNYSRHQVQAVNHVVGALFAAVLPLSSMVILYKVCDMNIKLALVCVFTVLFCLAMSIMSKARRIEVVAATAA